MRVELPLNTSLEMYSLTYVHENKRDHALTNEATRSTSVVTSQTSQS